HDKLRPLINFQSAAIAENFTQRNALVCTGISIELLPKWATRINNQEDEEVKKNRKGSI
ncbi:hypothetical protein EVAR_73959_1, partial [Eumeta japonica]